MKGKTIIELTDVNTKEVKRIEDCNMFTNALDAVFNKIPWWHSNTAVGAPSYSEINSLVPIVGKALGGLLLFPNAMEENAELLFSPASNKPTGIASFDGYTGEDTRRGSYNTIESGKIPNGFRFVWDFTTSAGNGPISCACLTSAKGGAGYYDSGENIAKDNNSVNGPIGDRYIVTAEGARSAPFGADENAVYYKDWTGKVGRIKTPRAKYNLFGSPFEYESCGTVDADGSAFLYEGKVCILRNSSNSSGNATITIDSYDPDTWEKTSRTISFAGQIAASNSERFTCVSNGYLYMLGNNYNKYIKVNLDNLADVSEIQLPANASTGRDGSLAAFNKGAIGRYFVIESDGAVHNINMPNSVPIAVSGCWMLTSIAGIGGDSRNVSIASTVLMPYIATINNLAQPIVKSATQTMKVTYIVTED